VLTRAGDERAKVEAVLEHDAGMDAALVTDVLRVTGRVGETLATRVALVEVCALLRALDACLAERISLEELRAGVTLHAERTDDFARFDAARLALRTLRDVLDTARGGSETALRAQVRFLHDELRDWLLAELTGNVRGILDIPAGPGPESDDPRARWRVMDLARASEFDQLARELVSGEHRHPAVGGGLPGTAWIRGWVGVAIPGEQLGDDPAEMLRLGAALAETGIERIVQVTRARPPRWILFGANIVLGDGVRASWEVPATAAGIAALGAPRRALTTITSPSGAFALQEADEHHVLVGPRRLVELICGSTLPEARARFLDQLEARVEEDEEPREELMAIATRLSRLRERAVGPP